MHGVEKIYKIDLIDAHCGNSRVFLVQSDLISVKQVCDKVNSERAVVPDGCYHAILVGKRLGSIVRLVEVEGLSGQLCLHPFQWELLQIDNKILSLESHNLFKSLFIEGDQSYLTCIAKSIWTLQLIYGQPLLTLSFGSYSKLVTNMISLFSEEFLFPNRNSPEISCFIILDRNVDYASALLRGCSYTSLLDEVFGINCGVVDIKNTKPDKAVNYSLSSSDEIYSLIKHNHFSSVFTVLSKKTKDLNMEYKKNERMELKELQRYVKQELISVRTMKNSLAYHISACEAIINKISHKFEALCSMEQNMLEGRSRKECIHFIEDSLAMEHFDKHNILRLIALLSLTQDGLYSSEAINLKNQFLHAYGYQNLPCFYSLERLGLFLEVPSLLTSEIKGSHIANKVVQAVSAPTRRSTFYSNAQKLKLFPETVADYDLKDPKDLGYVFGGSYIPLISQIVHSLIKNDVSVDELMKMLPNSSVKDRRAPDGPSLSSFLIYFIGGITYAEISSLDLLEKLTGVNIIVAGTSITSGSKLMKACF